MSTEEELIRARRRKADLKYKRTHKEIIRKYNKEYKQRVKGGKIYTLKVNARCKALRGISLKEKHCEECGSTKYLQRHHPDYAKPLDVRILCKKCHAKLRRANK
jgi:hypothetical protein